VGVEYFFFYYFFVKVVRAINKSHKKEILETGRSRYREVLAEGVLLGPFRAQLLLKIKAIEARHKNQRLVLPVIRFLFLGMLFLVFIGLINS
jgi:hypothetical protein